MTDRVWLAYYGGKCGMCGFNFNKGTPVRWEGGHVVEAECPPREGEDLGMGPKELKVYREQMCLNCFTVHAVGQEGCQ